MKKMNKFKLSTVALMLGLGQISAVLANESFEVTSFQLVGDIQDLTDAEQVQLAEVLETYQGKNKTLDSLKQAQNVMKTKLNSFHNGQYDVILPEQRIESGNVYFQLIKNSAKLSQVVYKGSNGFDEKNLENSLPSLKQNKFYDDGRQWFDRREFNMTKENPLKVTRMHYTLDPASKTSDLTVAAFSPYGKARNFIAVDNYGSREFKRGRLTLSHVNANLTGNDDILTLSGLTNFKAPSKSFALGLSYLRPFYTHHQTVGVQLGYSRLDSDVNDGLPSSINRKLAKGKTSYASLNWSYYLPQFDLGIDDQFKLNAGYSLRYYDQNSSIDTAGSSLKIASDSKVFSVAGINIGISGEIRLTPDSTVNMELTDYYYSSKLPGSHHMRRIGEGYNKDYNIVYYRLGYNQNFADGWNFNTQLIGQYTRQDLSSLDQFSVTGVYSVRGFKYNGFSGDKGLLWRTELSTPRYTQYKISPYVFYDMGQYRYNTLNAKTFDGKKHTLTSAGAGVRAELVKNLNVEGFFATRLANSKADSLSSNHKDISSKTTFWGRISYNF